MGKILKYLLSIFLDYSSANNTSKRYTPEGFVIHEQEQNDERWHGVRLCELSQLAQTTYRGKYVEVDQYGFLVFHYTSNSGKTHRSVQLEVDENGQLKCLSHYYYPGQWRDSADEFIEKANQQFCFI